ncbi:chaoptin [Halyomorpha halys]|uniref:chaoptin n=1 Tax=Halyomorpha halys TaxID=286706 RepID=UPI0006D4DC12|nr:protein artichoke [Halyomorpha halys]KAE8573054.1 hypothetical protein A483_HHAL011375 [Halyomorpha halys]
MVQKYSSYLQLTIIVCFFIKYGQSEWKSCPSNEMCTCQLNQFNSAEVKEINCTKVPFFKLPYLSNNSVDQLSITESGLEVLEDDSFLNLTAPRIILSNNRIHSVQDKVFSKMNTTLEDLNLDFNELDEIPINAIQYLEKLKILSLNKNQISSVVVNWSNLMNTVKELSLGGNEIENLPLKPEFSLMNMKALLTVNLAENALLTLEANSLPMSLTVLNASSNNIKEFPQFLLNNLQELQYFSLSNNFIESILTHNYEGKINLEELDLSRNLIESVGKWFHQTVKVKKLNLNNNKIHSVDKDALSGLECRKIDFSYNKLSKLDDGVFSGLQDSLEFIDLSGNRFIKLPDALKSLKSLQTLKFDYNSLLKLKSSLSSLNGLKKLTLAGNKITVFPYESLGSLKSLHHLDLSYNRIADIRKSDFKSWGNYLEKLFLQSNSILFLQNNTFEHASRITELSLSYNNIGSIDNNAFKFLDRSLEKLDISFGLKGFGFPTALSTLKSIKYLALDNNNINAIPESISNFENIETLILDFNNLKELKSTVFSSSAHKSLKEVRLSFNKIPSIDSKTFSGLSNLETVGLHSNKIIKISENAFTDLIQKFSVYLSNNVIEIIESKSFSNIPKLKMVDLHGNKLLTFDYTVFENVTTDNDPMTLNLSSNRIENLKVPTYQRNPVYISVLDLSHNKFAKVPEKLVEIQTSLKSLDLSYNEITAIESVDFYSMLNLEHLSLIHNKIVQVKPDAFISLKKLQILNLSHNHIEEIQNEQFKNLENLRILDLSFNSINNIPSNAFENTKVEKLSLSNNRISSLPSLLVVNLRNALRILDLSYNQIINIDQNIFQAIPKIYDLNLCHNKIIGDGLASLQNSNSLSSLQLCGNELVSIASDSFKNISNLRYLNLADTGLTSFPNITLPSLKNLNVSGNKINNITEGFFMGLPKLKVLTLSNNQLTGLSSMKWIQLQNLKSLDLSNNPIKVLDQSCFFGLYSLRMLNLQNMNNLETIDPSIFVELVQLTSIKLHLKSSVGINLSRILSNLGKLRELYLQMTDEKITNQLPEHLPKKLRLLEITGKSLKYIDTSSLNALTNYSNFELRITGTSVSHLPKHIFSKLENKKFTIDLSNNQFTNIGPELFYRTIGETRRFGSKAFPGGIHAGKNPLICGCNTKWLAQWMRRHLTEVSGANTISVQSRLELIESMNQIVCSDSQTKQMFPVLSHDVTSDETLCVFVLNVPKVSTGKSSSDILRNDVLLFISALFLHYLYCKL